MAPVPDDHADASTHNFWAENPRAISGLKGIIIGLLADTQLNDQEILFLDLWLRSQDHLREHRDAVHLLRRIENILRLELISAEFLDDLNQLLQDILQRSDSSMDAQSQVNELLGLISGIAADDVIRSQELHSLQHWLDNHPDLHDLWPANILMAHLQRILADGKVTSDERDELLETIKQITGIRLDDHGLGFGLAAGYFEDNLDAVVVPGNSFRFVGTFLHGSRANAETQAMRRGGRVMDLVSEDLDYLVVGTLASRDWQQDVLGRILAQALRLRRTGRKPLVITEKRWLDAVAEYPPLA